MKLIGWGELRGYIVQSGDTRRVPTYFAMEKYCKSAYSTTFTESDIEILILMSISPHLAYLAEEGRCTEFFLPTASCMHACMHHRYGGLCGQPAFLDDLPERKNMISDRKWLGV